MDITRLNSLGLSAAGLFPSDLNRYAVFGAEIVAPCSGDVIAAEGTVANRPPLDPDSSDRKGGNHVVLYCEGHSVHLAHMDTGSVTVAVGERVSAGQLLGRVGNSGNTMMPNLHVSAVRGRHPDFRSAAEQGPVVSVPLLIDGRFLIKGDSFTH
jgi:murein DD-endopeptidase MepM/ murein hydrolase activator NlpD